MRSFALKSAVLSNPKIFWPSPAASLSVCCGKTTLRLKLDSLKQKDRYLRTFLGDNSLHILLIILWKSLFLFF